MPGCPCCSVLSVRWTVVAADDPVVVRRCRRCDRAQPFRSSGRFRVNANGRRLDVWLVYRCPSCDASWNRPVHERVSPASLGDDLERYHRNDPALASAVAASAAGARIEGPADLPARVTLVVPRPVTTRLDRLVASHLGLSRRAVASLVVDDPSRLRRPPRHGDVLSLGGCPTHR